MATQVQFRGGTTSEHSTFTGVAREVTVDTTKKTVVVHDGSTAGGIPLAKESAVTSAAAITGGSINGTTVGASTASTGAFTTLSASSTVSGTGFSTYLASPPAIGGTTASTGRFTTVTATGLTSGRVTYAGASGLLSDSSKLTFDTSNLTVGVTGLSANADGATGKLVLRKPNEASGNNQITRMLDFAPYYPGYDEAVVKASIFSGVDTGTQNGQIGFMTATGGVLYEKMRLLANGNLGIGTSSPAFTLDVNGDAKVSNAVRYYVGATQYGVSFANAGALGFEAYQGAYIYWGTGSSTSATERMRITSAGNVGIGTSSPTAFGGFTTLELANSSGNAISLVTGTSVIAQTIASNTNSLVYTGTRSNHGLVFTTNDTERMRINLDGQLLLGTTSAFNSAFTMSLKVNSSTGGLIIQPGANDYTAIQFNNAAGTGVGSISVSSTLTSYNVTSDQRLKTNVVDAPSGNIDSIKVRSFDWILNGSHQEYGMVAQELIEVAPYAVTKTENPDDMMQVDYSKLVPMMIREIQDLKAEVNQLKAKIGV